MSEFGHMCIFMLWNSLYLQFSWTKSWERWPEANLKHFLFPKIRFLEFRNSLWTSISRFLWAKRKTWPFQAYKGCRTHLLKYYHGLRHGKCRQRHVWSILDIRKLCFGALETRFGVKKAKFCELRPKFGHLRSIKAGELTWWTFFLVYAMGNVARGRFEAF